MRVLMLAGVAAPLPVGTLFVAHTADPIDLLPMIEILACDNSAVNPSTLAPARLTRLRAICLSFPETAERVSFGDPSWTVNGKGFAAQKGNYGGGRPSLWFKPATGEREVLVASAPDRFFIPPYVGVKGWLAMYLDARKLEWSEVEELVEDSYRNMAPKRALKILDARSS